MSFVGRQEAVMSGTESDTEDSKSQETRDIEWHRGPMEVVMGPEICCSEELLFLLIGRHKIQRQLELVAENCCTHEQG